VTNLHSQLPLRTEVFISVDVETAGPYPGEYSLLSIGACTIFEPLQTFYIELKPVHTSAIPEALAVHHLSLEDLADFGIEPREAMARFEAWLKPLVMPGQKLIFVAFNAPFDWMFVSYYFYRYLRRNPFGHTALDIKAYYMGLTGVPWSTTSMNEVGPRYLGEHNLSHQALQDALDQACIFSKMLQESEQFRKGKQP